MKGDRACWEVTTFSFTDMQDQLKNAIAQAVEVGILSGYTVGSFRPFANIARMEMVINWIGLSTGSA